MARMRSRHLAEPRERRAGVRRRGARRPSRRAGAVPAAASTRSASALGVCGVDSAAAGLVGQVDLEEAVDRRPPRRPGRRRARRDRASARAAAYCAHRARLVALQLPDEVPAQAEVGESPPPSPAPPGGGSPRRRARRARASSRTSDAGWNFVTTMRVSVGGIAARRACGVRDPRVDCGEPLGEGRVGRHSAARARHYFRKSGMSRSASSSKSSSGGRDRHLGLGRPAFRLRRVGASRRDAARHRGGRPAAST